MSSLVNHLKDLGVLSIHFCAGSRNSSLIEVFKDFNLKYHFDERGSSFRALGEAKITDLPVVVCVTSGTAVAECLPAFIEAFYSGEQLIIISADRPARLYGTHAPQAIEQREIFSTYVREQYVGPIDNYRAPDKVSYPYQINLEIDDASLEIPFQKVQEFTDLESLKKINESISPLFLFSEGAEKYQQAVDFLDRQNIPVYVESLSRLKVAGLKNGITNERELLKYITSKEVDLIIRVGKTPITSLWRLLDKSLDIEVLCLNTDKTGLGRGGVCLIFRENVFQEILKKENVEIPCEKEKLAGLISKYPQSELSFFSRVYSEIKKNGGIAYVGNSMPIRYWEIVSDGEVLTYANRGANGIDGQLATCIGLAEATDRQVYCLVGDLTFLYDVNALLFSIPENMKIICFDNSGGRIFERVSVNPEMICEHKYDLERIAKGFDVKNIEVLKPSLEETRSFWSEWELK